ncbi:MAG: M64 family metallopeptidase, partial [Planctomycetota bacterium]
GASPSIVTADEGVDEEAAEEPFEHAPDPREAPGPDADLFVRAVALQRKGKVRSARRLFWKLIDAYPDSPFRAEARDRSDPNAFLGVTRMNEPRPCARRIDVALMGDGYLLDRQRRFDKEALGHLKVLQREPAFEEYASYFNFWRFNLASRDTGVDEVERVPVDEEAAERTRRRKKRPPRTYSTALDSKAAGPHGQVMANAQRVWHYLGYLPENDALALVFAKMGRLGMGGMGIATTGPKGVVVHEFGHAFAGLLDEYVNDPGEPSGMVEAANTTTNRQSPPWGHFLEAGVPRVGVYEGAATFAKGVWRPAQSCAMNTGGDVYCPVCREATVLTIYTYVSPIDEARPAEKEVVRGPEGWPSIEVRPMQPKTHRLEVAWVLGPAPEAADEKSETEERTAEDAFADEMLKEGERRLWRRIQRRRKAEGRTTPLPALLPRRPGSARRTEGTGKEPVPPGRALRSRRRRVKGALVYAPVIPALEPGRYQLTVVVRDSTRLPGARFPWVLKDERGLLEDRHAWILVVPDVTKAPPK